jgi:hypothetical protein
MTLFGEIRHKASLYAVRCFGKTLPFESILTAQFCSTGSIAATWAIRLTPRDIPRSPKAIFERT